MKTYGKVIAAAGVTALMSTSALAAITNIKNMEDGSQVNITGTVDSVQNEREFTLRDNTGTISVDIESGESVVLRQGDRVTVSGIVDKDLLGTDIDASKVSVNKKMTEALGDAIEGRTNMSLEGATAYNINSLPREGLVKVSGTVTRVSNEKEFTVQDNTGSINIDVESAQSAALTEGSEVTVVGYVDSGLFGKDINARKVMVTADASASR